ncbi:peptidase family M1 [Cooperia oncophora]
MEHDKKTFTRSIDVDDDKTLKIFQELESDVGGVVWDSALVAAHYFIKNAEKYQNKKVLELGAGTGVCGLVLAVLGADVIITDPTITYTTSGKELRNQQIDLSWISIDRTVGLDMYRDPTTSSNYDEIKVTHYFLEWNVCFLQKNIYGCIEMTLKALKNVDKIVLDVDKLAISSVNLNGQDIQFTVEPGTPIGEKIVIKSPISEGQEVKLAITYSTAKEAVALQFMDKEMTADKKAPYLFSQCQAIHARSIMPCMDTPSVKSTYSAEVTVPNDLVCLMSAIGKGKKKSGDTTTYTFEQPVAIPSYLLAIVVGHIERREISPRYVSE